jgi:hypothetical protein
MIDRRQFIRIGATGAVATAVAGATSWGTRSAGASFRPLLAVVDTRFPESTRFGRELARQRIAIHEMRGDVTALWYTHLHLLWKERPVAIAGLSGYGPMFCLERLGWDHGLRVIFRGEHRPLAAGGVEHVLAAAPARQRALAPFAPNTPSWPGDLARRVMHLDVRSAASGLTEQRSVTSAPAAAGASDEILYSWVIAPRVAA